MMHIRGSLRVALSVGNLMREIVSVNYQTFCSADQLAASEKSSASGSSGHGGLKPPILFQRRRNLVKAVVPVSPMLRAVSPSKANEPEGTIPPSSSTTHPTAGKRSLSEEVESDGGNPIELGLSCGGF
ncbi:hypothetical protein Pyn_37594 [Prunus yedoensis var. nudiflora]|uniref:Uncharacterized protein n=1 Tax=Prunus yedoensis var. nudiflora TaxID=2094558 RepID=A0A314Y385_PRUYE|nr:hypothetical protein Pyn_37594 [Prunus yedoensis var. nudiflora]